MIYLNNNTDDNMLSSFFTPTYEYAGKIQINFELTENYSSNKYYNSKVRNNYGTLTIGNLIKWIPDRFFEKNFGIPDNEYNGILSRYPIGSVVVGYSSVKVVEGVDVKILNSYFGFKLNRTNNGQNELNTNIYISPVLTKCFSGYLNSNVFYEIRKLGLAEYIINTVKKTADEYKDTQTYKVEYNNANVANVQFPQITPVPQIIVAIYSKAKDSTHDFTNDIFPDMISKRINIWGGKQGVIFDNIYGSQQDIFNYAEDMLTPDELKYTTILPVLLNNNINSLYFEIYVPKYLFSNYNNGLEITFLDQTFRINSTVSNRIAENCDIVDSSNVTMSYRYSIFRKEITVDKIEALNLDSVLFTIKKILPFAKQYSTEYLEPAQLGVNLVKIDPKNLLKISYQPNSFFKMPYISNRLIYGDTEDQEKWFILEKSFTNTNIDDLSLATFKNPHMRSYSGLGSYFYDIGNANSPVKIYRIEKYYNLVKLVEPMMSIDINISNIYDNLYIPDREYFNKPIKILNLNLKLKNIGGNLSNKKTFIGKNITQATVNISDVSALNDDLLNDKVSGFMVKKYIINENELVAFACIFDRILSHIIIGNDVVDNDNSIVISFFNKFFPKIVDVDIISDNFTIFKIDNLNSTEIESKINNLDNIADNTNIVNLNELYLPKLVLMLSLTHFKNGSPIYDVLSELNNITTDRYTGLIYSKLKYYNGGNKEHLYIAGLEMGKKSIDIASVTSKNPTDFEKLIIVNDAFLNNSAITEVCFPRPYIKTCIGNNVFSVNGYKNILGLSGHPRLIYQLFKNDLIILLWPTKLLDLRLYQESSIEIYDIYDDLKDAIRSRSNNLKRLDISQDYIARIGEGLDLSNIEILNIRGLQILNVLLENTEEYANMLGMFRCKDTINTLTIENFKETAIAAKDISSSPYNMSKDLMIGENIDGAKYSKMSKIILDKNIKLSYRSDFYTYVDLTDWVKSLPTLCKEFTNLLEYFGSFLYLLRYRYAYNAEIFDKPTTNRQEYIKKYAAEVTDDNNNSIVRLPIFPNLTNDYYRRSSDAVKALLTNFNPYSSVNSTKRANTVSLGRLYPAGAEKIWWTRLTSSVSTAGLLSIIGLAKDFDHCLNLTIYGIPGLLDVGFDEDGEVSSYDLKINFSELHIYPSSEIGIFSSTTDGNNFYNVLPVLSNQTYSTYKHNIKYLSRAYLLKKLNIKDLYFLDSMLNLTFSLEEITYNPDKCVLSYDREDGMRNSIFTPYMKTTVRWKYVEGYCNQTLDFVSYLEYIENPPPNGGLIRVSEAGSLMRYYCESNNVYTIEKSYPITDYLTGEMLLPFISEHISAFDIGYFGNFEDTGFWQYHDCENANRKSIFNIFSKYRYVSMRIKNRYSGLVTTYNSAEYPSTHDIVNISLGLNKESPSLIRNVSLNVYAVAYDHDETDISKRKLYDRMVYILGNYTNNKYDLMNYKNSIYLYLNGYNLLGYTYDSDTHETYYNTDGSEYKWCSRFNYTIDDGLNILSQNPDPYFTSLDIPLFNCNYDIPICTYGVTESKYGYNPVIIGSFIGSLRIIRDDPEQELIVLYNCLNEYGWTGYYDSQIKTDIYLEVRLLPKTLQTLSIDLEEGSTLLLDNPIFYAKHNKLKDIYITCEKNLTIGPNALNILSDYLVLIDDVKSKLAKLIFKNLNDKIKNDILSGSSINNDNDFEYYIMGSIKSYIRLHVNINDVESSSTSTNALSVDTGWFGFPGRVFLDTKTGLPPGNSIDTNRYVDSSDNFEAYGEGKVTEIYTAGLDILVIKTDGAVVNEKYIYYTLYIRNFDGRNSYGTGSWINSWTYGIIKISDEDEDLFHIGIT